MSKDVEIAPRLTSGGYVDAFRTIASKIDGLAAANLLDLREPGAQFIPAVYLKNSLGDKDHRTLCQHFAPRGRGGDHGYSIADPDAVFDGETGWGTVRSAIERLNATDRMKEFGSVASPVVNISSDFDAISVTLTFLPREPAF